MAELSTVNFYVTPRRNQRAAAIRITNAQIAERISKVEVFTRQRP